MVPMYQVLTNKNSKQQALHEVGKHNQFKTDEFKQGFMLAEFGDGFEALVEVDDGQDGDGDGDVGDDDDPQLCEDGLEGGFAVGAGGEGGFGGDETDDVDDDVEEDEHKAQLVAGVGGGELVEVCEALGGAVVWGHVVGEQ